MQFFASLGCIWHCFYISGISHKVINGSSWNFVGDDTGNCQVSFEMILIKEVFADVRNCSLGGISVEIYECFLIKYSIEKWQTIGQVKDGIVVTLEKMILLWQGSDKKV